MKVAFLTPYLSTGGAERALLNIAQYFFSQGVEVDMVAAHLVADHAERLPAGIKLVHLKNSTPLDSPALYANSRSIARYLKSEKPDVVISTSDYLNIALLMARGVTRQSFKVVISQQVHISSFLQEIPLLNRHFIRMIQRMVSRKADLIIAASAGVATDYALLQGMDPSSEKLKTIFNPIYEPGILQLASTEIDDPKFHKGSIKLITVGRLVKQKDQVTLVKAIPYLLKEFPQLHLYLVGIGTEEPALKILAGQLGITSNISFLGYKDNPYAYVARCDLFVLSSVYEGFGNVLVEALATGTNVVSTDCPSGPAEILENGKYGWLCPIQDPEKLARQIINALFHKKPASVLQDRARMFSTETIGKQYLDAVKELFP